MITSGTVDIPTASAPIRRKKRRSAGDSNDGPERQIYTPCFRSIPDSSATLRAVSARYRVVGFAHIREPLPEFLQVGSYEGGSSPAIPIRLIWSVIIITSPGKIRVYRPGSVGHDQVSDPQALHHPDRKGYLIHGVAFVIMRSPLHHQDAFPLQRSNDQPALMPDHRGNRPIRDLMVGYDIRRLNCICQTAQPGSKDYCDRWGLICLFPDCCAAWSISAIPMNFSIFTSMNQTGL